jgi:uncharacterized protein YcgI (DUF1989 family)
MNASIENVVCDDIVPAGRPWGRIIKRGEVLRIVDLHGQQAVDFLCYAAAAPSDRYNAMNTMKLQGNVYVQKGTVLYSDRCNALFTVIEDTCGSHDTIAACCSEAANSCATAYATRRAAVPIFLKSWRGSASAAATSCATSISS